MSKLDEAVVTERNRIMLEAEDKLKALKMIVPFIPGVEWAANRLNGEASVEVDLYAQSLRLYVRGLKQVIHVQPVLEALIEDGWILPSYTFDNKNSRAWSLLNVGLDGQDVYLYLNAYLDSDHECSVEKITKRERTEYSTYQIVCPDSVHYEERED